MVKVKSGLTLHCKYSPFKRHFLSYTRDNSTIGFSFKQAQCTYCGGTIYIVDYM